VVAVMCLVCGILASAFFEDSVTYLLSPSSNESMLFVDDLGKLGHRSAGSISHQTIAPEGLSLEPGTSWTLTWRGECQSGALPFARISYRTTSQTCTSVGFRLGSECTTITLPAGDLAGLVAPRTLNPGATDFTVTLESINAGSEDFSSSVIKRIEIGSRVFPNGQLSKNFYLVGWMGLFPYLLWSIATGPARFRWVIGGSIGALLLLAIAPTAFHWLFVILVALVAVLLIKNHEQLELELPIALGVAALILPMRWGLLASYVDWGLSPDALEFWRIAQAMVHPYDTEHREPVFVWVVKLWLTAFGWKPVMLRVLSIALAYLQAVLIWKAARLFVSPLTALLILAAAAYNVPMIISSVRGLREEIVPLFLLGQLYCAIVFLRENRSGWLWMFLALSAVLPLVRLNALIYTLVLVPLVLYMGKQPIRYYILAFGLLLTFLLPLMVYQQKHYKDPLFSSNGYVATYYRDEEFGALQQEANVNISMMHYLFGLHTLDDVVRTSIDGVWRLTFGKEARNLLSLGREVQTTSTGWLWYSEAPPRGLEVVLFVCYAVGFFLCVKKTQGWMLLLPIILLQFPLAFLVGKNLLYWRLTMNTIPISLILAGIGSETCVLFLRRLRIRIHGITSTAPRSKA